MCFQSKKIYKEKIGKHLTVIYFVLVAYFSPTKYVTYNVTFDARLSALCTRYVYF